MLVKMAQAYSAEIFIECGLRSVNAKSIMGILTLGAGHGAEVMVTAEGRDATAAIRAIEGLFACAFHEEQAEPGTAFCGTEGQTVGIG